MLELDVANLTTIAAMLRGALTRCFGENKRYGAPWPLAMGAMGLILVPITAAHLPLAHAGATFNSVGARHNARIALGWDSLWAAESSLPR